MSGAWLRYPTVHGETVVFVCEDDLWSAPIAGGVARRLTSGLGACARPRFSPDGAWIAFDSTEEGVREVYVVDRLGGPAVRRTWFGDNANVLGWRPSTRGSADIVFSSAHDQAFARDTLGWTIPPAAPVGRPDLPERLPYGPIAGIAMGGDGRIVLCRHAADLAGWKGYRGGRMGTLWTVGSPNRSRKGRRPQQSAGFVRLPLDANVAAPCLAAGRLWFVADPRPSAVPQLMSALLEEGGSGASLTDLRTHTDHADLAVRFPTTDGRWLVYAHGGDLYRIDTADPGVPEQIAVEVRSQRTFRQRRFASPAHHLEGFDLHPDGHSLALTLRGRPFVMGHWEGAVRQLGAPDGVRYRHTRWVDGSRILVAAASDLEEALELHSFGTASAPDPIRRFADLDHGRIVDLEVAPTGDRAAFTDHRHRLYLLDLASGALREVDRSDAGPFSGIDWSADGRWLAWSAPVVGAGCRIRLWQAGGEGEVVDVTDGAYRDVQPSFDPDGDHLYFLSFRDFDPVLDTQVFNYSFPRGVRPYVVTLRRDLPHPFQPEPRPLKSTSSSSSTRNELQIDLDRIGDRVVPFPVPEGRYEQVLGVGQGRVLLTRAPIRGLLHRVWYDPSPPRADLQLLLWDFDKQECTETGLRITAMRVDRRRNHAVLQIGSRLRVTVSRPDKSQREELKRTDGRPDRRTGWIDLGRVKVSVDPGAEWRQMLNEAWRLMRDHFWEPTLAGVDWASIRTRYADLVARVSTRSELSDLVSCMQGELGTSHAYEMGGEYARPPTWRVGRLGADLAWDDAAAGWRIVRVIRGEPGDPGRSSPLIAPGAGLVPGEVIVGVHGQPVGPERPLEAALVHQSDAVIVLTVSSGGARRDVTVRTLSNDRPLRYRDWVLRNRGLVHAATGGQVGYVHVADMGTPGFGEFHRDYARESERGALIVDVRYNTGGHVSQLLLATIGRERLGYKVARWMAPIPYPRGTVTGPMVALTNECAGSDGDIFSHAWKRLRLGPLIGTRTWGGVVGIAPRQLLVDRALTTQPEYATWFDDVGFDLENRGTEPDIEVVLTPEDWAAGRDPQLERGITEILTLLATASPPPRPPEGPR